jgi:hypothetical protein
MLKWRPKSSPVIAAQDGFDDPGHLARNQLEGARGDARETNLFPGEEQNLDIACKDPVTGKCCISVPEHRSREKYEPMPDFRMVVGTRIAWLRLVYIGGETKPVRIS